MQTVAGCPETALQLIRKIWATCGRIEELARDSGPDDPRGIIIAAGQIADLRAPLAALEAGAELLLAAREAGRREGAAQALREAGAAQPAPRRLAVVG